MKDPIVEEVRTARQDQAEQFNHDLMAICADLKKIENEGDRTLVGGGGVKNGGLPVLNPPSTFSIFPYRRMGRGEPRVRPTIKCRF
jgi:hypothetical protein